MNQTLQQSARADRGADDRVLARVRQEVRGLLERSPGFENASPELRRNVAHKLVRVSMMGARLLDEERSLTARLQDQPRRARAPLAVAQTAGENIGMNATREAAGTIRNLREALDFPTFVASLINGVFNAITSSTHGQLASISDLLDNVSATEDEFTDANVRDADVIAWVMGKLPLFRVQDGALALNDGVDLDDHRDQLRSVLGLSESEAMSVDGEELEETLFPAVRRKLGRDRQAVLASMVQMGLQRIVVDEGRLHASMDMRVDASSIAEQDTRERTEASLQTAASGQFGLGNWGASASVAAGFSKVQSDALLTREEVAARAGLRSSVDLAFRTDQVPLDRLVDADARARIDRNARVPVSVAAPDEGITSSHHVTPPTDLTPTFNPEIEVPTAPTPPALREQAGGAAQAGASDSGAAGTAEAPGGGGGGGAADTAGAGGEAPAAAGGTVASAGGGATAAAGAG